MNCVRKSLKYSHELLKHEPKVLEEILLSNIRECVSKATVGTGATTVELFHVNTIDDWDFKIPLHQYNQLEKAKMNEYIITATFRSDQEPKNFKEVLRQREAENK